MKKCIILLFAAAGLFGACNMQMEETFDENSSKRLDKLVADVCQRLTSAPNGWVIEYYPDSRKIYGGVNILVKFNGDNTVEMINESASDAGATSKSTWTVNRSQGAVLSFDTYNEYICRYADPGVDTGETEGGVRYGYQGDLEFAVKEMTDNAIEMKGTKTGNRIILRKLPAAVSWADYLNGVETVRKGNFYFVKYVVTHGDKTQELTVDQKWNKLAYTYQDEATQANVTVTSSFIYTDRGIKFYEPLELFGLHLQNFEWDKAAGRMKCTDAGATSVYMQGAAEPYFRPYDYFIGEWKLHSSDANGNAVSYDISITELEYEKTFKVNFSYTNSNPNYGLFDLSFVMNWYRSGRAEAVAQDVAKKDKITYTGSAQPQGDYFNVPVILRPSSATGFYNTLGAGIITKTELHENPDRVDFQINAVQTASLGITWIFKVNTSNVFVGPRWMVPIYMVKK